MIDELTGSERRVLTDAGSLAEYGAAFALFAVLSVIQFVIFGPGTRWPFAITAACAAYILYLFIWG